MSEVANDIHMDVALAAIPETPHNSAHDSIISRIPAQIFERIAQPLIEHIYGPIAEKNHTLGVIAVNGTLTLPRIPIERKFGKMYERAIDEDNQLKAATAVGGKLLTKLFDGIDGPVARGTHTDTEAGAIIDPGTDMAGSLDDALIIIRRAKAEADYLTASLMYLRIGVDVGVVATNALNLAGQKKLEANGVVVEDKDKAKASAVGKIKYGIGIVGNEVLLSSYIAKDPNTRRNIKRSGQAITGAAIVTGVASIFKYGRAAHDKFKQLKELKQQAV